MQQFMNTGQPISWNIQSQIGKMKRYVEWLKKESLKLESFDINQIPRN